MLFLAPLSCSSRATGPHPRTEGSSSVTQLGICQEVTFPVKPAGGAPGPVKSGGLLEAVLREVRKVMHAPWDRAGNIRLLYSERPGPIKPTKKGTPKPVF